MNTHLFDFDFTRVGMVILFIVPALINLLIAGYVYLFLPRGRTNNLFSFFVFLLATWQLFDGFMHLSTSEHSAEAWYRLSRISLQFVMPLGVLFLLRFTRWHKQVSDKIIFSFLLFPAIVFCVIINLRINSYEINPTSAWAWVARPQPTITAFFILFFRGVEAMLMLIIPMAYFMNDQNDEVKRKQAMLLFIAFLVPVCSGFVFEIVLPLVSQYDELPVASSLMTTFSIIALIAIKRYKFLEYSPLHHWENIVDSTSEGILIINGKGQIMYINKALCTLVSYAPREMEGKVAATLFCGSNEKFVEDINKAYNAEMTLKAKFGRKIWVLMNATPYRDVAGNTIGSICILTNITPLKEREASLRQVIDAVRMVTIDIDFAKKAVKLSGNAGEILGLPVEFDNIAGVIDTCVHPDDKYKVRECFSKHEDGTVSDFEFRFIRPDTQQTIWLERRSEAVKDANGKIIGAKGLLIDITAHKMTEEATHTLSERLKEAQAISHVGHWEVDYCKDTTTWSDETYNVLGYTPGGVQSSFKNFLARIHPDDREHVKQIICTARKQQHGFSFYTRVEGDDIKRHVYCEGRFIMNEDNRVCRVTGILQDVTRTKMLEQTLKESNKELETYIYKASHDLRAPITSILGLAHISKYDVKHKKALDYINKIEITAQKLDETIKGLVQSLTIKDTNQFNDTIKFDSLINDTLSKYELKKEYSTIRIQPKLYNRRSFVSNKFILESLFQNLIENAIKYQKADGKNSYLNIQVKDSAKGVEIKFEDNGIGMDPTSQARAFDMYYRGTNQSQGSGLGLYLVKTGVEKLGGTIHLQSAVDKGTTMTLNLPCLC